MYTFKASSREKLKEQIKVMKVLSEKLWFAAEDGGIDIQIFDTSIGLIFRVCEAGYGLKNQLWKNPDLFPLCNYDDRVDIEPEDEPNAAIAIEVDRLISDKQYILENIVAKQTEARA